MLEAVIIILICLPFAHARLYDVLLKENIFLFRLVIIDIGRSDSSFVVSWYPCDIGVESCLPQSFNNIVVFSELESCSPS